MLARFIYRNTTKEEFLIKQLKKAIWKQSHGAISKSECERLAQRTVRRLDFSNPYQMHKSIEGYAEILVANYIQNASQLRRNEDVGLSVRQSM